jgi:hypothetical protein
MQLYTGKACNIKMPWKLPQGYGHTIAGRVVLGWGEGVKIRIIAGQH